MNENSVRQRKRILRRAHMLDRSTSSDLSNDAFTIVNNHQQRRMQQTFAPVCKKADALTCSICEGLAHGYNFDAITCESCKAFFRRNALKADVIPKCRVNNGECIITVSTRKRCKACRLAKCFEKGMRADWILTDEERLNKRQKIEENRRLRQILYPDSSEADETKPIQPKTEPYDNDDVVEADEYYSYHSRTSTLLAPLSAPSVASQDLIKIQQVQQAYSDSVRLTSLSPQFPSYPHPLRISDVSDMLNFLTNILATRLITYLKLLPEFSSLNEHDKFILIKYNTFTLTYIRAALNFNPLTDTYHEPHTDECIFIGHDIDQCLNFHQYSLARNCLVNLLTYSFNDRFVLQMLLIIMAFSKGSALHTAHDEIEPLAQDVRAIYHAQNVFVNVLWRYCEKTFGYSATIKLWLQLTMSSIDAHLQASNTRHGYVKVPFVPDQLAPLLKSVLLVDEK